MKKKSPSRKRSANNERAKSKTKPKKKPKTKTKTKSKTKSKTKPKKKFPRSARTPKSPTLSELTEILCYCEKNMELTQSEIICLLRLRNVNVDFPLQSQRARLLAFLQLYTSLVTYRKNENDRDDHVQTDNWLALRTIDNIRNGRTNWLQRYFAGTAISNIRSCHPHTSFLFDFPAPYYSPSFITRKLIPSGFLNLQNSDNDSEQLLFVPKIDEITLTSRPNDVITEDIFKAMEVQLRLLHLETEFTYSKNNFKKWKYSVSVKSTNREIGRLLVGPPEDTNTKYHYGCILHLRGYGLALGLGQCLVRTLFSPIAVPNKSRLKSIHISFDTNIPYCAIVAFSNRFPRYPLKYQDKWVLTDAETEEFNTKTGNSRTSPHRAKPYLSNRSKMLSSVAINLHGIRFIVYDKALEIVDNRHDYTGVTYARNWEHFTRFEAQIELSNLKGRFRCNNIPLNRFFDHCPNFFDQLEVIDLRTVNPSDIFLHFLICAKCMSVEEFHLELGIRMSGDSFVPKLLKYPSKNQIFRLQKMFRKRCLEHANEWPTLHPSSMFNFSRETLQEEFNKITNLNDGR